MTRNNNIAARAGRWSAAHWKTATFGWLALVVTAVLLGSLVGTRQLTDAESSNGETARAEQILADAGIKHPVGESVLVQSRSTSVRSPAFRSAVRAATAALARRPEVTALHAPVVSKGGHSSLIEFDLKGPSGSADARVVPVLATVASVQRAHPAFRIAEFGEASADRAVNSTVGADFARAEQLSVPLTFLILLLAFGAFVAAGLPVLLALSAVLGSVGISALVSHVVHAADTTSSMILLMGMAVGVDYSLFYVKREREERAAGHSGRDALHRAAATSGRAVLISGVTVLIAMSGMLLAGSRIYTTLALGAMIVVFMSMVGSLTVLPALLGKLGDRIDRGVLAVLAAALVRVLRWEPWVLRHLKQRRTVLQRLKGRIMDVDDFVDAVRRVAGGGTALDPEVVAQLFARRQIEGPLGRLTPREGEVLALMAEGRSNAAIARELVLTIGAVEKHVASILGKLQLPPSDDDHRRVLAVLAYLRSEAV